MLLSADLSSSATPVRDALNQLTGESLVETRSGEGFHRPHLTAPDLQDLYRWAAQVTALVLRESKTAPQPGSPSPPRDADLAGRAAILFLDLARHSANLEHRRAIGALNDRLHAVRIVEPVALDGIEGELETIENALAEGAVPVLHRLVAAYFRRRARLAHEIVRAAYRE